MHFLLPERSYMSSFHICTVESGNINLRHEYQGIKPHWAVYMDLSYHFICRPFVDLCCVVLYAGISGIDQMAEADERALQERIEVVYEGPRLPYHMPLVDLDATVAGWPR